MKRAILAAVLVVASVASVSAQDRPNFEGTWQIDTATSRYYGGAPTETITVDGSRMTISRTVARSTATIVYMLDGTPSKNMVSVAGNQIEMTYTSRWEGNALVVEAEGQLGAVGGLRRWRWRWLRRWR